MCYDCNGSKRDRWPNEFYNEEKLMELSKLTNIEIKILSGNPTYNMEVISKFILNFDKIITELENWGRREKNYKKEKFYKFWLKELKNLKLFNKKNKNLDIEKLIYLLENHLEKTKKEFQ